MEITTQSLDDKSTSANRVEKRVAIEQILDDPVKLRGSLAESKEKGRAEKYAQMKENIAAYGLKSSILVRPARKPDGSIIPDLYGLVDGFQRFSILHELGWPEVPVIVDESIKTEADVRIAQISCNLHRIENSKRETAQHCLKMNELDPTLGLKGLAKLFNKTEAWACNMLRLEKLCPVAQAALNDEILPVTHACTLARLPASKQPEWLDKWVTGESGTWQLEVVEAVKALKEGKEGDEAEIVFKLRSRSELRDLLDVLRKQPSDATYKLGLPVSTWIRVIEWIGQVDPETLALSSEGKEAEKARKELSKLEARTAKATARAQELTAKAEALKRRANIPQEIGT